MFARLVPAEDTSQIIAGPILLGVAPGTAQAGTIVSRPLLVLLIAVPRLLQSYGIFPISHRSWPPAPAA